MSIRSLHFPTFLASCLMLAGFGLAADSQPGVSPVKVFILAGQSNMQGHAHVRTIDWLGEDQANGALLRKVKNADGTWVERDDVWIFYPRSRDHIKKGKLTGGLGASDNEMGPELMFGHIVADKLENQVLLIKTAWGGRSLAVDFRPPSAGPPPFDKYPENQRKTLQDRIANGQLKVGFAYAEMLAEVKGVLANLQTHFPAYDGKGYELAGFIWFQGWNDMIDRQFTAEYPANLGHLIRDLRRDLAAPKLPVVVAEMGVDGREANANILAFRKAQQEGCASPEFAGNVTLVPTWPFWDEKAAKLVKEGWEKKHRWEDKAMQAEFDKMGSQPGYHYLGSAKILSLIGKALADAAVK